MIAGVSAWLSLKRLNRNDSDWLAQRNERSRIKSFASYQRVDWDARDRKAQDGLQTGDRRPEAAHPTPLHALTEQERAAVLQVANELKFADMPPARIVPTLADEGVYLASESTFSRVLRAAGQNPHRGRAKAPHAKRSPQTHLATAPRQVWCWDLTFLPAQVVGQWFYLYLILDLYSRKVVGWEVQAEDDGDHAAKLVHRTALAEGIAGAPAGAGSAGSCSRREGVGPR